jgi:hypothetical protein
LAPVLRLNMHKVHAVRVAESDYGWAVLVAWKRGKRRQGLRAPQRRSWEQPFAHRRRLAGIYRAIVSTVARPSRRRRPSR